MAMGKPSREDEIAFMESLLASLEGSVAGATQRPPDTISAPARSKQTIPKTPPKKLSPEFESESLGIAELLDGMDESDWDDMYSDFLSPQKVKQRKNIVPTRRTIRCTVESVHLVDGPQPVKRVLLKELERSSTVTANLIDDWIETTLEKGDVVNVIGKFESASEGNTVITISSKDNLLIVHPDILLTATAVANASQCLRRPLLSMLVRSGSEISPSLVWGNMIHEIMQRCFMERKWDEKFLATAIKAAVKRGRNDLLHLNISADHAAIEVRHRCSDLLSFGRKYMSRTPKGDATLSNPRAPSGSPSLLSITDVIDVEEDIWAPNLGLKGKIDVSVRASIIGSQSSFAGSALPFEIKTGRESSGMEHRAQTMLYTLLMSERYGVEVASGLLYYTQSGEVTQVHAGWNEIRSLIILRNLLASYIASKPRTIAGVATAARTGRFPPTIDDERICGRCYVSDTCMLYKKAVEDGIDNASPISSVFSAKTGHLTQAHAAFFKKWEELLTYEEREMVRFRKELWTISAEDREDKGRCLSNMVLDAECDVTSPVSSSKDMRIHQYSYRFTRQQSKQKKLHNLLHGQITIGDAITVSVVPNVIALARGFVLELTPENIVVGVDHVLSLDAIRSGRYGPPVQDPVIFRIDKDELSGGMSRVRDNLAQMFYAHGDRKLLKRIVDLEKPRFRPLSEQENYLVSQSLVNSDQQQAMKHALSALDYSLILGMPGTGKTTTVAALIELLVKMGKTILLTSYTHSAVDTILLKLKEKSSVDFLRLGNLDKIHRDIQSFSFISRADSARSEELEELLMKPSVVATTCLSIDHVVFSKRSFDYCIVDEASQVTLPTCIGPLRFADKYIFVGDHFQLPPLVRNKDARSGGLDVSLFRTLQLSHPKAVIDLSCQYRMNEDIMFLANKLIYNDRLKCGDLEVARRCLTIPFEKHICAHQVTDDCWLQDLLRQNRRVIFVDTDFVPAKESRVGDLIQNEVEACLIQQTTDALLKSGVDEERIGIISLYRQQVKLISNGLAKHKRIEILTADRSQGRDKDCIMISLVRANDDEQVGDLLKDWRRINVAFTRARSKLIIFGSRKTLRAFPLLAQCLTLMDSKGWILRLPPGADKLHNVRQQTKRPAPQESSEPKEKLDRPEKKAKALSSESGIWRSRPILRDLINGNN